MLSVQQIVSGGQTGVDRAALDIAIRYNIPHGGWCPKGRLAEDGTLPPQYNLEETDSATWDERTRLNIRDSDATLVLINALPVRVTDGTQLTISEAKRINKPLLVIDIPHSVILDNQKLLHLNHMDAVVAYVSNWLLKYKVKTLNIAGPRASQCPDIYQHTFGFLSQCFDYEIKEAEKNHLTL